VIQRDPARASSGKKGDRRNVLVAIFGEGFARCISHQKVLPA
jgi:hypothetical protein